MDKIVVLNQKKALLCEDVLAYVKAIKDSIRQDLQVILCPSSIYLPYFKGKYDFKLGAQDVCFDSLTGEVTGAQLKSVGVKYVIVGHSERKKQLNETDKIINLKIKECLKNNLIPIVCVGETKEENERKKTAEVIVKQLKDYFSGVKFGRDIIIAYEPIWAIGTGNIPTSDEIADIVSTIKNIILKTYNLNITVLYGGSINVSNIDNFNDIKELDGYFLGRVSSSAEQTLQILDLVR